MENLFDQVYKDGFVVNKEKPMFVSLSTNMKLGTNIEKAQLDYGDSVNKLYNINKGLGFQTSIPKTEFMKIKEANTLLERNEPKIQFREIEEYEELKRMNLQIQNRLNERSMNIIDTAYAPQGLTPNQVIALSSTRPQLQKEIEAIEEYARTHFLTAEQTKKLKEELVKKNYNKWKKNVNKVKKQQMGNEEDQTEDEDEEYEDDDTNASQGTSRGEEETSYNVLQSIMTMLADIVARDNQPSTNEMIYDNFTEIREATQPQTTGIRAEGGTTSNPPRPQPRFKSPLVKKDDGGDKPIVNPTRPIQIDNANQIQDKEQYPSSYVGDKPIVNINSIPNNVNYTEMVDIYFKNFFLLEFSTETTLKRLDMVNNFMSYFQENTETGKEYIRSKFFDKNFNFTSYIERFISAINQVYTNVMKTQDPFFIIQTNPYGAERPYRTQQQRAVIPDSPLQRDIFVNVMITFLSECRNVLLKNLQKLYLVVENNKIKFNSFDDFKRVKEDVKEGKTTGLQLLGQNTRTDDQRAMDKKDYEKTLKEIKKLKKSIKEYETKKQQKEDIEKKGKTTKLYPETSQKKHGEKVEELKELEKRKEELEKKLGIDDGVGGGAAGGGGSVRTGPDGTEIVEEIVVDKDD